MQWFGKPYTPAELSAWNLEVASGKVQIIFGHTGYLINLGAPEGDNRQKSIRSLKQEIELSTQLGLPFLVMHPGAHLKQGEEVGIRQVISGLNEVFNETVSPTRIALEITAGQGTSLGAKIEHLAAIFDGVKQPDRLGVCLDTAHLLPLDSIFVIRRLIRSYQARLADRSFQPSGGTLKRSGGIGITCGPTRPYR